MRFLPLFILAILYQFSLLGPGRTYLEKLELKWSESKQSQWIQGKSFLLEYSGYPNYPGGHGLFVENREGELKRLELPARMPATDWKRIELEEDKEFRFVVKDSEARSINIGNFYAVDYFARSQYLGNFQTLIILLLTAAILFLKRPEKLYNELALYTLIAAAIHFRPELFFREDDWMLLQALEAGFPQFLLTTHNEHFIPLFYLFFALEKLLLGFSYPDFIFISCILHGLNARLLRLCLCRISSQEKLSSALALVYLVSPLHSETIQWMTMQSSLLSTSVGLAAILFALDKKVSILKLTACLITSPLFFGIGLVYAPLIFALGIFRRQKLLLICSSLCGLFSTIVFLAMNGGEGGGFSALGNAFFIPALEYAAYGSFFALPSRALGFLPVDLSYKELLGLTTWAGVGRGIACGGLLTLALLLLYFKQKREYFYWGLFGLLFIFAVFSLPAIGRFTRGAEHALVLRYNSPALPGLLILTYPLLIGLGALLKKYASAIGQLCLAALVFLSISNSRHFEKLANWGRETRDLYERSKLWDQATSAPLRFKDTLVVNGRYFGTQRAYQIQPQELLSRLPN